MGMVVLKSRYGPFHMTRREQIPSAVGFQSARVDYDWSFDNDFRCAVPAHVWEDVKEQWYDKRLCLRYRDILTEL